MFFGTTPSVISQFLYQEIKEHKPKRVFVPFAGNFVIEQICGLIDKNIEVHSTDVSLYSRAIGYALCNANSEIRLKQEMINQFPDFKDCTSPEEIAALVIFFTEVAPNLKKSDKPYYATMNKDAVLNHKKYLDKIIEKIKLFKSNIGNIKFYGVDACEIIPNLQKGDICFYDPPVLLGDYEKMFKAVGECFDFTEPPYTQMTEELKWEQLSEMDKKGVIVYYRRNDLVEPPKNYNEIYRYQYKYDACYSVMSNNPKSRWVGRFTPLSEQIKNYKLIGKDDVITEKSKIKIVQVPATIGNHYRLLWVKKARMTSAGWSFLIFVDDKLIGATTLQTGQTFGHEWCIIYSDPACPNSRYKRLSKLMLYVIGTKEVLNIINEISMWEHTGFTTRVFTNEPVSMKYRGIFDLHERKEDKKGNWKYNLLYHKHIDTMPDTMEEGMRKWLQKDGKQVKN